MGQRSIPAPFLTKTYELVDDESTNDVVSWGDEGSTFVVWKTAEFAKDLLPKYFKHNNFSSFVRQLNTYGFHKIVADKWEFANDNFKKGQKDLLSEIHRRKSSLPGKVPGSGGSLSVSGDEAGSTSTSSPGSVEIADLSGENEKLRQDNKMLFAELAHTRKYCEELMGFLTAHMNMGPDQINKIIGSGAIKGRFVGDGDSGGANVNVNVNLNHNDDDNDNDNDNSRSNDEDDDDEKDGLKIFGVWFKEVGEVVKGEKRGRCCEIQGDNNSNLGLIGPQCGRKVMKIR